MTKRIAEARPSGSRRMNAVEFSKTGAVPDGRKKAPDSRQRPPLELSSRILYESRPRRLLGREVDDNPTSCTEAQLKNYSASSAAGQESRSPRAQAQSRANRR